MAPTTTNNSLTTVHNQPGQKVGVKGVTNINSKISDLFLKKSNLESQLKSLSSRKAKLIAGISIAALTTTATAVAIAIIAALSISISVACTIALPVLFGVSVIALTVFIFRLKNTYKEINKHSPEKDSLELENRKLEYKREELERKFPCTKNFFFLIEKVIDADFIKKYFSSKNEDGIDKIKDFIFHPLLNDLHGKEYNFQKDKDNIKKEKQEDYISYKYEINNAKDTKNNGLCMEVKFYF